MTAESDWLRLFERPRLEDGRLVMALTGWMDGGDVSTGTVSHLVGAVGAKRVGEIDPEPFYVLNMPGPMEIATLFRPQAKIEDGLVTAYRSPAATFFAAPEERLLLFEAREPNLRWGDFADALLAACHDTGVTTIYFVGSYAGLTPHTREPRVYATVSDPALKPDLQRLGLRFSDYQGPCGFTTYLATRIREAGLQMVSLIAEIPAYVQGRNPKCIEAMIRRVSALLALQVSTDDLRRAADEFEERLSVATRKKPDLQQQIRRLEEDYDQELFNSELADLRDWLQQQGIRLD